METDQHINPVKPGKAWERGAVHELVGRLVKTQSFVFTVHAFVMSDRAGNRQHAEDIVMEGLVLLGDQLLRGQYKGDGNVEQYAIGICKNLWRNWRRKSDNKVTLTDNPLLLDGVDNESPTHILELKEYDKERDEKLAKILDACCSEGCLKIIRLRFFGKMPHEKIAGKLKLKDANSAKSKLYDCLKTLRKCAKEKFGKLDLM